MSETNEIQFSQFPVAYPWYAQHRSEVEVPPTPFEVARSYSRQWYRLNVDGAELILRPQDLEFNDLWPEPTQPPEGLRQLSGRFLITWWNVAGQVCSSEHRSKQYELLNQFLSRDVRRPQSVCVISEQSQWIEPAVLVDCEQDSALEAAAVLGQNALVRLEDGGVRVLHLKNHADRSEVIDEEFVPLNVITMAQPPCPLSRGPEIEFPVKRQGGPGTSRGHEVAAMWQAFAGLAHGLVRCNVHGDGDLLTPESGSTRALYELAYPSRFSPMQWLPDNEISINVSGAI
jgi:hypothetical protein